MNYRITILSAACILVLFAFSFSPLHLQPASAHISKSFGDYIVQVGWTDEPPLTGQKNSVVINVVKGSHIDTGKPVINALADMKTTVKFGTVTKQIDFLPSPTTNGQYISSIVPTKTGTYGLVLSGTIEGQKVDAEIPLDEVESIDTISFPSSGGSSGGSNNAAISSQLGTIVSQLTGDISDAKKSVDTAAQSYKAAAKSIQDQQAATERVYMISMVGIGLGSAGIVIGVFSINRKNGKT